jgi:hypothetical protein
MVYTTPKSFEVHKLSFVLTRCMSLDASPRFQKFPRHGRVL